MNRMAIRLAVVLVLGLILAMCMFGCGINPVSAKRVLEAQGLTKVEIGGYSFIGCGDKDSFRSSFTAVGVDGKPVSGIVCSSWLKGITVRYN